MIDLSKISINASNIDTRIRNKHTLMQRCVLLGILLLNINVRLCTCYEILETVQNSVSIIK